MAKFGYFKDKSFLVTGASSGIGQAAAIALLQNGAMVAGAARSADKLADLEKQWAGSNEHGVFKAVPGDASIAAECKGFVEKTVQAFGRLDGVIHSAGVSMRAKAVDTSIDVYQNLMNINYFSLIHLFHAAYPHIAKSKGHFVAISSVTGHFSTQMRSGYAASKHAVQGWMDSVRIEVADEGIHLLTVSPGFVRTNISLNAYAGDGSAHGKMDSAIGEGMDPADVAKDILDGIQRRKRDVFPAQGKEKLALFINRVSPSALDSILKKNEVT